VTIRAGGAFADAFVMCDDVEAVGQAKGDGGQGDSEAGADGRG
jgi:hypothetical protein